MTTARALDVAAVGVHDVVSSSVEMLVDLPAGEEPGAEADRLVAGALGQPHAGDAAREAQVVADHRRRAGLTADGLGLDDDRGQSPSDAPYTAAARPAGPAPTMQRSTTGAEVDGVGTSVDRGGHLAHARRRPTPRGTASRRAASAGHRRVTLVARHDLAAPPRSPGRRRGAACPSGRGSRGSPASARPGSAPRASPSRPRAARPSSPSRTSSSQTAVWNSSSRLPRGISR